MDFNDNDDDVVDDNDDDDDDDVVMYVCMHIDRRSCSSP